MYCKSELLNFHGPISSYKRVPVPATGPIRIMHGPLQHQPSDKIGNGQRRSGATHSQQLDGDDNTEDI
jgi:hypothetical protein